MPRNVLPLHPKPTSLPPMIWIFTEGDGIEWAIFLNLFYFTFAIFNLKVYFLLEIQIFEFWKLA